MKGSSVAEVFFRSTGPTRRLGAFVYLLQAGKLKGLFYYLALEIQWWCCVFMRRRTRQIEFVETPFFRWQPRCGFDVVGFRTTLSFHDFAAVELKTKWRLVTESTNGVIYGSIEGCPVVLQRTEGLEIAPTKLFEFESTITAIICRSNGSLFVGTKGRLYKSKDGGKCFDVALELSSPQSYVWHNHGIAEFPTGFVVGEYGTVVEEKKAWKFWTSVANLYVSLDDGKTWRLIDYLKRKEENNKHVHLVKYSENLRRLLVTNGDNKKRSYWIDPAEDICDAAFEQGRFDSFFVGGGHTAFCESGGTTFLGTDYLGGTNSIVSFHSGGAIRARMLPHPYRRYPVTNMHGVARGRRKIVFASVVGGLSTRWKSLLLYSDEDGASWKRLIEYDGIDIDIEILNGNQKPNFPLVLSVGSAHTGERTILAVSPSGVGSPL